MTAEPRVTIIEGRKVLVTERRPPLPSRLDRLIAQMRITLRVPITITGWRADCGAQEHRLLVIFEGIHRGTDNVLRELRLLQCADCEAVCVRDITFDRLPRLATTRRGPARRDEILGWYSGARRNQRQYR